MPQEYSSNDSKIREFTDAKVEPVAEVGTQNTQCTVYRDAEGKCSVVFSHSWDDGTEEGDEGAAEYTARVEGMVSVVMAAMALSPSLWFPDVYSEFISTIEDTLLDDS